jgi:hypothetical protein
MELSASDFTASVCGVAREESRSGGGVGRRFSAPITATM